MVKGWEQRGKTSSADPFLLVRRPTRLIVITRNAMPTKMGPCPSARPPVWVRESYGAPGLPLKANRSRLMWLTPEEEPRDSWGQ